MRELAVALGLVLPVVFGTIVPQAAPSADSTARPASQEPDRASARRMVATLREAAARDDRAALSALMRYPLEVTVGGLRLPVPDRAAFLELYGSIMTAPMKRVINRARVPDQGSGNRAGRVASSGEISFEDALVIAPVRGDYLVTRLAVPVADNATGRGAAASAPRSLTFRVGRPTQVSGSLAAGGRDAYTFHAVQGAFIDARLTGVPGRTVLLRLVHADTGAPLDARAGAGTRVWTGRVGAPTPVRIEVVRQPDSGTETLIYTLSVTLK